MEKILARVMTSKKMVAQTTTMADISLIETVFGYDDLSTWEIINPEDDDEEIETYSFSSSEDNEEEIHSLESEQEDLIDRHQSIDVKVVSMVEPSGHDDDYDDRDGGSYDCDVMDDDAEEDYDDDYDDELVPRSFSDRFGKQRLMKSGNRACNPKMSNPKKLPCYFYDRPGGAGAGARNGGIWKRKK